MEQLENKSRIGNLGNRVHHVDLDEKLDWWYCRKGPNRTGNQKQGHEGTGTGGTGHPNQTGRTVKMA